MRTGLCTAGAATLTLSPQVSGMARLARPAGTDSFSNPAHSQTVVGRLGVNIQPGNANEYANFAKVKDLLGRLGVRKIRSRVMAYDPNDAMPYLEDLHTSLGITMLGTAGDFPLSNAERSDMPSYRSGS